MSSYLYLWTTLLFIQRFYLSDGERKWEEWTFERDCMDKNWKTFIVKDFRWLSRQRLSRRRPWWIWAGFSRFLDRLWCIFFHFFLQMFCFTLLYTQLCLTILPLFILFYFRCLWPHWSCPNAVVISNTAFAHLHATAVDVYLALFSYKPLSTYYDLVKIQQ